MAWWGRQIRALRATGEVAPDFEARDHTGALRRLSDYRGRTLVLWFYPMASTPG